VDLIEGLSPAISIEQKSTSHNPRSTVGTVTEIYDYLRLLFARVGEPRCPEHGGTLAAQTVSQMVDHVLALPEGTRLMLLAPVVAERKGEHVQILENLRAQGYVRARIDGKVMELDEAPALEKNVKHSIEAVVDRVVVRPDQAQRLAESFETALKIGDGVVRAITVPLEEDAAQGAAPQPQAEEHLYSARYACAQCGYSISELEPRLFSFNNPAGACPSCDGLGVRQYFDPARVVSEPGLTLPAGAIRGWDRRNAFYFSMLESLARHYKFDLEMPFEDLPKKIRDVILHGSGQELINFAYHSERGGTHKRKHAFEGVIPNMERRYRETDSNTVREELAKYLGAQPCEDCGGSRLRIEARHVSIEGKAIHDLTRLPIGGTLDFFRDLKLEGARREIADKIAKEIQSRLGFLVNVGLDYLNLARSAESLSGGEAQRIRLA
jgi:excinuclease ABC subunit A